MALQPSVDPNDPADGRLAAVVASWLGLDHEMDPGRQRSEPPLDRGPQLAHRMAPRQVMQDDRVVGEAVAAFDEILEVEVFVTIAAVTLPIAEEGALEQEHPAGEQPRLARENSRSSVAAITQPVLLEALIGIDALLTQSGQRLWRQTGMGWGQAAPPPNQVISEARHHVIDGECLDGEIASDLDPLTGGEAGELELIRATLELGGGGDQLGKRGDHRLRAEDPGVLAAVQGPLRKQVRHPEGVVEMAVAEKQIAGASKLTSAAASVERQPRRVDAKPGRVAGPREAFDRELTQPQLSPAHAVPGSAQISRYSQRRTGVRRVSTDCQSGSISHSAAAIEDSSELPSCGVKQKP